MIVEFVDSDFASDCSEARRKVEERSCLEHLGKGSLATVDLVSIDGETYVIKCMPYSSADKEKMGRIENEVKVIHHLMQSRPSSPLFHPRYLAAIMIEGGGSQTVVIVMEHEAEAVTLHRLICSGPLDEPTARGIIKQVAMALGRMHEIGHCLVDLKPENVLLRPSSSHPAVRLIDFDLSRPLNGPALGEEEKIFGTLEYLSPELIDKTGTYSTASDFWALGILSYECLYGQTPFAADTIERVFYAISNRAPQFPHSADLSFNCTSFIRGLLRHKTEYRLGSKGGVSEVLSHLWLATDSLTDHLRARRLRFKSDS